MLLFFSKDFYDNNFMSINASIIDKCNYSCTYCCNRFPRTNNFLDLEQLEKFILYVLTLTNKKLQITLIGGETMLHPKIHWFCERMKKINVQCIIFSNFSLQYLEYDKMPDNVKFTISWHNAKNDIFLDNVCKIQKNKITNYSFYVMYEHNNIQKSISVFNKILKKTRHVLLKKIFNTNLYNETYTTSQLKLYDDFANVCKKNDITVEDIYEFNNIKIKNIQIDEAINPFKHWKCFAGKDNLHITEDGDIYPCCALQPLKALDLHSVDKFKIGNIFNFKAFKLHPTLICQAMRCCNYEILKENILNKKIDKYLMTYV